MSAKMGYDKVNDHHHAGAEYIVSADMSCLMHQKGCAERARPAAQVHPHRPDPERGPRHEARSTTPKRPRQFIEAKDHVEFHDKRLWDLRKKRDRESEAMPEWEDAARRSPRRSRSTR